MGAETCTRFTGTGYAPGQGRQAGLQQQGVARMLDLDAALLGGFLWCHECWPAGLQPLCMPGPRSHDVQRRGPMQRLQHAAPTLKTLLHEGISNGSALLRRHLPVGLDAASEATQMQKQIPQCLCPHEKRQLTCMMAFAFAATTPDSCPRMRSSSAPSSASSLASLLFSAIIGLGSM